MLMKWTEYQQIIPENTQKFARGLIVVSGNTSTHVIEGDSNIFWIATDVHQICSR